MNQQQNLPEKASSWLKNSVTVKLITITVLMLLLLIPTSMIKSVIRERESLNNQATTEVSSKWAREQKINGPILTIPLIYEYGEGEEKTLKTKYWYILPNKLNIDGNLIPKRLERSIYEVVVYKSEFEINGNFIPEKNINLENLKEIKYQNAFLSIGISDLRGIEDEIQLKWGKDKLKVEPGSKIPKLIPSGITVNLPNLEEAIGKEIDFNFKLNLQGSQNISFVPLGNTTNINLQSDWKSPSFSGNFLPDHREVSDSGFVANWKILQMNRNFPQSWVDNNQSKNIEEATFGVDLILPLDDYQKSFRSAKYAAMTIVLTFLMFFLVEILNKIKIHPFQYALVGVSLCVFYVLLVSISEHSNFNFAYTISSIAIIMMISLYSLKVFGKKKLTSLLLICLIGIYGFLFTTIQLTDYALLMGSIGLILILAATMYFTRNVNWYKANKSS